MGTLDPLPKGVQKQLPNFRPISVVAKWLDELRCHFACEEVGLGPGDFMLDGDPAPPPHKGGKMATHTKQTTTTNQTYGNPNPNTNPYP